MSQSVCDRLELTPEETNRRITTAPGVNSPVHGTLEDVHISFDYVVEPIYIMVIEGRLY